MKIMKNLLQAFLIVLFTTTAVWAQQRPGLARIHAAKMAYITDRLHLTSDQSYRFIPLYNDYEREIQETRQYYFKKYRNSNNMDQATDAASLQYIDDNLDYQQQVIEIKRKYNDRFLKIISPQQLADLYKAEREFKQLLLQRLKQRNGGGARNNRGNGY